MNSQAEPTRNHVLSTENIQYLQAISLLYLHLRNCHWSIRCPFHALIGQFRWIHFTWSWCGIRTAHPDWLVKLTLVCISAHFPFRWQPTSQHSLDLVLPSVLSCCLTGSDDIGNCALIAIGVARPVITQPSTTGKTAPSDTGELLIKLPSPHVNQCRLRRCLNPISGYKHAQTHAHTLSTLFADLGYCSCCSQNSFGYCGSSQVNSTDKRDSLISRNTSHLPKLNSSIINEGTISSRLRIVISVCPLIFK